MVPPIDGKKIKSAKKRTANAVKQFKKAANARFRPYFGNSTSYWHIKTTKELKKEQRMP